MKISRIARIGAIGAVAALALAGCAANEGGTPPAGEESTSTLAGELIGAGSSAQEVAVQTWAKGFQTANPEVTLSYDPAGSGAGRESFQAGAVAFAGSDRAFKTDEIEAGPFGSCADGSGIVEIPAYISPIAVIFNIEGIDTLNLDPATIAGIFAGTITKWNDPAIAATNDGVELPDLVITPVHRADDSGTTENFTDYLAQAAPEVWTYEADGEWPIASGEAAPQTSGVIAAVSGGQGTIGYADASRAADFGTVAVQVGENFVPFSPEAAAAVLDASPFEEGRSEGELAIELDRTPDGEEYPIILLSYSIACEEYADPKAAELVKPFLEYIVSTEGQDAAAAEAGSAPISDSIREKALAAIDLIVTK